jgi:ATP-dependent exoDNAse (exonuclease V) beta subunit
VRERSEAFGRLVHALLALPDAGAPAAGVTARTLAPQFGLGEPEAAAAADLARRARGLPEIAAAASADVVYRDLPFVVPMDGGLTTGRIDLAYRRGGAWTIVDFKSAGLTEGAHALEAHGAQVAASAGALAALTGAPVSRALWLLGSGRLLAQEYSS